MCAGMTVFAAEESGSRALYVFCIKVGTKIYARARIDSHSCMQGTGIDPELFLAMPPELQREVLGEEAANEPAAERPQPMDTGQGGQEAAPGLLPSTSSSIYTMSTQQAFADRAWLSLFHLCLSVCRAEREC